METKTLSRERIIWHLSVPVCEIMSGVRTHVQLLSLLEQWQMCYALHCDSPEELVAVMWQLIQQHKRRDSEWQNLKLESKAGL